MDMKKFRYNFPKLTLILIIVGLAACLAGFIVNLYVCITQGVMYAVNPYIPLITYILMFAVTIVASGLLISILCASFYRVDDKAITTYFGIIRSSYDIKKVDTLVLDRETNKLLVYMEDESYIAVVIKSAQYQDFVQAVIDVNPVVGYAIQSIENTPDDNEDKKNK